MADPKAGTAFVWLVSFLLFFCVAAGGGFLLYYMLKPETDTPTWYPIAGVALVCLPWFFWFITFLYRTFSRILRVRIGDRTAAAAGGGGNVGNKTVKIVQTSESFNRKSSRDISHGGSFRRHVSFGAAAMVVDEQDGHGRGGQLGRDDRQDLTDDMRNHGSSTSSINDVSLNSRESELPLASSMASSS